MHASNSAENVAPSTRRLAGSVRDVSYSPRAASPRVAASSSNPDGRSPSAAELAASSGTIKRLSASTSQLRARNDGKETSRPALNKPVADDAVGKNARKYPASIAYSAREILRSSR